MCWLRNGKAFSLALKLFQLGRESISAQRALESFPKTKFSNNNSTDFKKWSLKWNLIPPASSFQKYLSESSYKEIETSFSRETYERWVFLPTWVLNFNKRGQKRENVIFCTFSKQNISEELKNKNVKITNLWRKYIRDSRSSRRMSLEIYHIS